MKVKVCPGIEDGIENATWNNFWRDDEGDPADDDEETGGEVNLEEHRGSTTDHVHLQIFQL